MHKTGRSPFRSRIYSDNATILSWRKELDWNWAVRLAAVYFIIFCIFVLRRPDGLVAPQFWAEDASVFFADQVNLGFLAALVHPYGGYLDVVPRLIAGVVSLFPVRWAPLGYAIFTLAISSLCCAAFAFRSCRNLLTSDGLRIVACLVMSADVCFGVGLLGHIDNLQWYLAIGALILVFHKPGENRRRSLDVALAVIGLLIALSTPLLLILVPWLIWHVFRRQGSGKLLPAAILAGLAVQLALMLDFIHRGGAGAPIHLKFNTIFLGTVGALISRTVFTDLLGHHALLRGSDESFMVKLIILLIVTTGWLTSLCLSVRGSRRRILPGALSIWILSMLLPLIGRQFGHSFTNIVGIRLTMSYRYYLVPASLLIYLVALTFEVWWPRGPARLKQAVLIALFSAGIVGNFMVPALPDLFWASYAPQIEQWIAARNRGEHVRPLKVPVNPKGWYLVLSKN